SYITNWFAHFWINFDSRSDSVAVTLRSYSGNSQPIVVGSVIKIYFSENKSIQKSVMVQIAYTGCREWNVNRHQCNIAIVKHYFTSASVNIDVSVVVKICRCINPACMVEIIKT